MAIGRGVTAKKDARMSGYLSDESDFYGDEDVKQELEERASNLNVLDWWENKIPSLTELANANITSITPPKSAKLYNPYEGLLYGRQLAETVENFLSRLPPSTTPHSHDIPWLFISNPYRKAPSLPKKELGEDEMDIEGPPEEGSQISQFVYQAGKLLLQLTIATNEIEKKKVGKTKAVIMRAVNVERDAIVKEILGKAVELHCSSGKWMIFAPPSEVNEVWSLIAKATANNELGIAAKVIPYEGDDRKDRLVCIYTKDFADMKDVCRVVTKLKDLGLVNKTIYYKPDAYTYLGIDSKNPYNIKASLYNSKDVLEKSPSRELGKNGEGYFYQKKKDEGH